MTSQPDLRLYLSLDVENLEDSVHFYTTLFGLPPTQLIPDYATFDVDKPALHLTLQPKTHCCLQGLNHMGLRLESLEEVEVLKSRLTTAGFKTGHYSNGQFITNVSDEPESTFWVRDPSKYRWEVSCTDKI